MTNLLYTGLGDVLAVVRKNLPPEFTFIEPTSENEAESLSSADVFVIGPHEPNPIKAVQHIYALDKYISVIVLVSPTQFTKVKQSLQFAPFVGKNALCVAFTPALDLTTIFRNASLHTRQRRNFSRINKTPKSVTSIASSSVKVENFGIFLEQAPIGALLVDEENRVLAINQKAKQLFHSDEQKHYVLKDFFPALSLQQLKFGPSPDPDNSRIVQANGMYLELHLSEVKNHEGKTLNIILVNDITEQKKRESALVESEALFRFMAEAMPQKVWMADETGNRNFFNQKWIDYTGLSLEELRGWGWTKIVHPDDREANLLLWEQSIASGNDFEFEHRLLRKDGEYRWHLVRGVARKDAHGKVLMWVGTNTDIHEQIAFAEELERRVRVRTYELEKSNSELEQFVYVTSHDLQEPLRKIRMFSEMLKDALEESLEKLNPASQKYLDKISATALRMSTLLKELLNFTQMSKQEQFEKTDLNQIVGKALVDLELIISEKGAIIHAGKLPVINAIPVQMHQLFYNLINNALKFSKPDVLPEVEITCKIADHQTVAQHPHLQHEKPFYEIVVQDNGIGFDQHYAEQIFHIFQRLHTRSEYSGTGIGLALCKKVVTNHYGAIYALSEQGKGAAFHILLPVN